MTSHRPRPSLLDKHPTFTSAAPERPHALPNDHSHCENRLLIMLDTIQRVLDFEGYQNPQFGRTDGLGRVGVAGFVTGLVFGVHLSIAGCCIAIKGLVLSRLVSKLAALTIGPFDRNRPGIAVQDRRAGRFLRLYAMVVRGLVPV